MAVDSYPIPGLNARRHFPALLHGALDRRFLVLSFEKTRPVPRARARDSDLIGSLIGSPDRIGRNSCEWSCRFLRVVASFSAIRQFYHSRIWRLVSIRGPGRAIEFRR